MLKNFKKMMTSPVMGDVINLLSTRKRQKSKLLMKIVNIDEDNLYIS